MSIEVRKRREKVKGFLLKGVSNQSEMSAALNVSPATICKDVQEIMEEWRDEDTKEYRVKRAQRIKQLELSAQRAINAFDRSRNDSEEVQVLYTPQSCKKCNATGLDRKTKRACEACNGEGIVNVETIKRTTKGQAGDSTFLKVFNDSIKEIAKLEGLYAKVKQPKVAVSKVEGAVIHAHVAARMDGVPAEVLLEAREAYEKLLEHSDPEEESIEGEVIEEKRGDITKKLDGTGESIGDQGE
jgi:hypothetical protein